MVATRSSKPPSSPARTRHTPPTQTSSKSTSTKKSTKAVKEHEEQTSEHEEEDILKPEKQSATKKETAKPTKTKRSVKTELQTVQEKVEEKMESLQKQTAEMARFLGDEAKKIADISTSETRGRKKETTQKRHSKSTEDAIPKTKRSEAGNQSSPAVSRHVSKDRRSSGSSPISQKKTKRERSAPKSPSYDKSENELDDLVKGKNEKRSETKSSRGSKSTRSPQAKGRSRSRGASSEKQSQQRREHSRSRTSIDNKSKRRTTAIIYAILTGLAASLAAAFTKLTVTDGATLQHLIGDRIQIYTNETLDPRVYYLLRILTLAMIFLANTLMWTFLTKSLSLSDNTVQISALNSAANLIFTGTMGYFIFEESISQNWIYGAAFIFIGAWLINAGDSADT